MNSVPSVSVVLPARDRAHCLGRALSSLVAQTFFDFEAIVVDDGSQDTTASVAGNLGDPRIRCLRQPANGVCTARNRGAEEARAPLLTFLDSDDEALPGWLERLTIPFADPGVGIVCCGAERLDAGGGMERLSAAGDGAPTAGLFLAGTFAVRRDLFDEVRGYWEELTFSENTELAWRLASACQRRGLRLVRVDEPLLRYHRDRSAPPPAPVLVRHLASSHHLLRRHGPWLRRRHPRFLADLLATAAVRAARLGRWPECRRLLRRAVATQPGRPRHLVRLLLACVPPLASHVWRPVADGEALSEGVGTA